VWVTNIIGVKQNTGQVTGKWKQYTISENKEPQNSRYLIRGALQRHERKCMYINESTSGADASVLCTVYYYTHIHELSKIP